MSGPETLRPRTPWFYWVIFVLGVMLVVPAAAAVPTSSAVAKDEHSQETRTSQAEKPSDTSQDNGKRLDQEKSDKLRKQWSTQRGLIRTAEIRAQYFLSGMQEIPRNQVEAFLAEFLAIVNDDPSVENVEGFVRKKFPVRKQSWRKAVLSTDGKYWREQLGDEVRYGPPSRPSMRSNLSLKNFWIIPSDELLQIPCKVRGNGRVHFEQHSEDRTDSIVVDLTSGHLLDANLTGKSIALSFGKHRYQGAFRDFSGISFPTVTVDIDYRDDELYMVHLFLVEDAKFNQPLKINPPD